MDNLLNVGVAKSPKRKLKITDIDKKTVTLRGNETAEKIVFKTIEESTGKPFNISDAWIDYKGTKKIAGLWFNLVDGQINQSSTLAQVINFYNTPTLGDFIGKTIIAYPDKNDFLVIAGCEME